MAPQAQEIPTSIIQNYIRLQHLINTTLSGVIRNQFRAKWKTQFKSDWENLSKDGIKFIETFGQRLPQRIGPIQRELLELGDIQKWDILLLIDALECLGLDKDSSSKLEQIKDIRITCLHQDIMEFDNPQFEVMWHTISTILTSFGVDREELLKIKIKEIDHLDHDQEQPNIEDYLDEVNIARAEEFKQKGIEIFRNEKYKAAIFMFSEALKLPGIRSKDIAALYSNRSIAHLKSADPEGAKKDAKSAIQLHPSWWKPYHRLASAFKAQKQYEKAIHYLSIARGLEPRNPYIANDWYHCRHLLEELRIRSLKENITMGSNYRHSRGGFEQDDKKAYEYFSKAAAQGSAAGFYYIAHMTKQGLGTTKNVSESIRLMELAAEQEPISIIQGFLAPNPGVKEAQHSLGIFYGSGDEILKDFQKAEYWYRRAIQNFSGPSANTLGFMYYFGREVVQDIDVAINYWKIGCWLKDVHATANLAVAYGQRSDRKNTHKFYAYGISQGSTYLKINKTRAIFEKFLGEDLNKPLNIQEFEQELLNEIKSGPLKNLVPETFDHDQNRFKKMKMVGGGPPLKKNLLTDPFRVELIRNHRSDIKEKRTNMVHLYLSNNPSPGYVQPKPVFVNFTGLMPIYFRNMTYQTDHVYTNCLIALTLIEDPIVERYVIRLIGEDAYRDVKIINIYKFKQLDNKKIQDSFGFGCNISIANPEYRVKFGGKPGLWVKHPSTLFHSPALRNKNRCRYCGDQRPDTVCRRCKRAFYCSDLCKKQDKLLMHSDICKKGTPSIVLKSVENPGYGLNPRIHPVPLSSILRL